MIIVEENIFIYFFGYKVNSKGAVNLRYKLIILILTRRFKVIKIYQYALSKTKYL